MAVEDEFSALDWLPGGGVNEAEAEGDERKAADTGCQQEEQFIHEDEFSYILASPERSAPERLSEGAPGSGLGPSSVGTVPRAALRRAATRARAEVAAKRTKWVKQRRESSREHTRAVDSSVWSAASAGSSWRIRSLATSDWATGEASFATRPASGQAPRHKAAKAAAAKETNTNKAQAALVRAQELCRGVAGAWYPLQYSTRANGCALSIAVLVQLVKRVQLVESWCRVRVYNDCCSLSNVAVIAIPPHRVSSAACCSAAPLPPPRAHPHLFEVLFCIHR